MSRGFRYLDECPDIATTLADARVLYSDIDGTMVAKGGCILADADGVPSARVAQAIVTLNSAGVVVVPVSGRNRNQLLEFSRALGWDSYIGEAGGLIVRDGLDNGDTVFNIGEWSAESLDPGRTPYQIIEDSGAMDLLAEAFPGRIEYHDPWHENRDLTHVLRGCVDATEAQRVIDHLTPAVDIVDNGIIRRRGNLRCEGEPHAYHLVPRGVTKGGAIRADLEARGLAPDQAVAIGDSATDLEMGSAVGTMLLVGNALDSPGVVRALDSGEYTDVIVTRGHRGDGWAEFVEAWLGD
jgi:hydroxymethylpyrimidine pyrophosphatase-like HAD family hydrolase